MKRPAAIARLAAGALALSALALCAYFQRRRATAPTPILETPKPWNLSPDVVREGFARVMSAIPVDDEELARAKPAKISTPQSQT